MIWQCSKNIVAMKLSTAKCVDYTLGEFFFTLCEIVYWSITSTVHCDVFVVDRWLNSFCADCYTQMNMCSDDVRTFWCICKNVTFTRSVKLTVMYEVYTLQVQKYTLPSVIRIVWARGGDIFQGTKVVVHIVLFHWRHVFLVTFL
jgi:hypothetical protein